MKQWGRVSDLRAWVASLALALAACGSPEQNWALGAAAAGITMSATSPLNDLEQTYYLGSFDPAGQLPPSFYRVIVRGQASWLNTTRFASGWIPARYVDSLGSRIHLGDEGNVSVEKGDEDAFAELASGRRQMLFGPEGFMESPRDHRLVILMGANPEAFFQAVDAVVGAVSQAQAKARRSNATLDIEVFKTLLDVQLRIERLRELQSSLPIGADESEAES